MTARTLHIASTTRSFKTSLSLSLFPTGHGTTTTIMSGRRHAVHPWPEMAMTRGQITILLTVLLLSAVRPSLAQQSNSTSHHSKTAGGFTPTTVVVLVVLISAFSLLTLFSIYINRCAQARALPRRALFLTAAHRTVDIPAHSDRSHSHGLDRELVEAFPTAVYGDVKAHMATKSGSLECAVCLTEFADSDELRILPACCHVFHPDCIDPWLAGAVTCPLCRADLTVPPALPSAESCDLTGLLQETVQEESGELDEEASSVVTFTPESAATYSTIWRHEFIGAECYHYRRTQSAMDAPDRHTLRLPEHVMKELAAVRRHRRAASLAEYPNTVERTPGWLTAFFRSMSWRRQSRAGADSDTGEEQGGSKRIYPLTGSPAERPGESGSSVNEKESSDVDTLNRV